MEHLRLLTIVHLLALLMPLVAYTQDPAFVWAKGIGGPNGASGYSLAIDASGNVYITGYFRDTVDFDPGPGEYKLASTNDADIFVTKLDANGNFVWARQMEGGTYDNLGPSISIDHASGYVYIAGHFGGTVDFDPGTDTFELTSTGNRDVFVCKLDTFGNFEWAKRMGGSGESRGQSIAIDAAGNVFTTGFFRDTTDFNPGAGTFNLTSLGYDDIFISKLDPDGNFVWAKQMGTAGGFPPWMGIVWGNSIAIDGLGNVYTTGQFLGTIDFNPTDTAEFNLTSNAVYYDIFISKLDPDGNFLWAKQMGGAYWDWGNSIAIDTSGNVYTTGFFRYIADFDPGADTSILTSAGGNVLGSGGDIFISKLDSDGKFVWAKRMGGSELDESNSIAVDALGNVYTTGYFSDTADFDPGSDTFALTSKGAQDIFISKLDSYGNFLWAKQMGGISEDEGYSIAVDASGNVYATGYFRDTADFDPGLREFNLASAGYSRDIFIVKLSQPTISVTSPQFWDIFKIYPNPAGDYFTLHLEGEPCQIILIELFSNTGQTVFREALDFQSGTLLKNYSCRDVPAGMYLVRVSDARGSVFRKIIIE